MFAKKLEQEFIVFFYVGKIKKVFSLFTKNLRTAIKRKIIKLEFSSHITSRYEDFFGISFDFGCLDYINYTIVNFKPLNLCRIMHMRSNELNNYLRKNFKKKINFFFISFFFCILKTQFFFVSLLAIKLYLSGENSEYDFFVKHVHLYNFSIKYFFYSISYGVILYNENLNKKIEYFIGNEYCKKLNKTFNVFEKYERKNFSYPNLKVKRDIFIYIFAYNIFFCFFFLRIEKAIS